MLKVFSLLITLFLVGCSSENSKYADAINKGLANDPTCSEVPVGIPLDYSKVGKGGALELLIKKGIIQQALIHRSGQKESKPGYQFTDKGNLLVVRPLRSGFFSVKYPCVRNGNYEVSKVHAVDIGNDASGKKIASVRASIKFIPEDWILETKDNPQWVGFWAEAKADEKYEFIYQLVVSGDEAFYQGKGRIIK